MRSDMVAMTCNVSRMASLEEFVLSNSKRLFVDR